MSASRGWPPTEPEDFALYDGPHAPDGLSVAMRGCVAFCVCGWHPKNHPGYWLADHLRDMGAEGYSAPIPERSDTRMRQQ